MVCRTKLKIVEFLNNYKTIRIDCDLSQYMHNRLFQLKNDNPIPSKTESQYINICKDRRYKKSIQEKDLCAPDSSKFFVF